MSKGSNSFIKPGHMTQKLNEYDAQRKREIKKNLVRMSPGGYEMMAKSLLRSNKNGKINSTQSAKWNSTRKENNKMASRDDDDDDDFQMLEGDKDFSSSDGGEHNTKRISRKQQRTIASPPSTIHPGTALSIESVMTPFQHTQLEPPFVPLAANTRDSRTVIANTQDSRSVNGHMTQMLNEYDAQRKRKIEWNLVRMSPGGYELMAKSLLGSNNNGKINSTRSAKWNSTRKENNKTALCDDEDEDFQMPEGGRDFSSSDGDEHNTKRTSRKQEKTIASPPSTIHSGTTLPIESVMTPSQQSPLEPPFVPLKANTRDSLTVTANTHDSQTVDAYTQRRVRGPTRGRNTERLIESQGGGKLIIEVPLEVGAPVGVHATKFSTWLGLQIRIAAPLKGMFKWDDIPLAFKAPIIQAIRDKFEILDYDTKEHVSRGINKKCQKLYRSWRHKMKDHYEKLVTNGHNSYSKPYKGVNSEDWAWMIDNVWTDSDKEARAQQNKISRGKLPYNHTMGSESFPAAMSRLARESNGQRPHIVDFYKTSHYNEKTKEWVDPKCKELHERLEMRRQEVEGQGSTINISQEEMSVEILGGRSGYLKGYGVGPKPSSSHRTHVSSRMEVQVLTNQVDTLKDVCQMQEKQIESLKNLCQNQEDKISTYDSQFEIQNQLMTNQSKKIEHLEMFMCQYLQGDRGGSNAS